MTANGKRTLSGPGAADFLTSGSGEDLPGTSSSKGASQLRDDALTGDARTLTPDLGGERDRPARESAGGRPDAPDDQRTGSQTGTIGGGGADAHNASPIRATGVDDPSVEGGRRSRKRTTKKYQADQG
jgi:hypothetical protein